MTRPHLARDRGWLGDRARGASMGRTDCHAAPAALPIKFFLRHIRLTLQGYDSGGAYWGHGARLYWASDGQGTEFWFRALDRNAARAEVRKRYPLSTFFN